MICPNCAREMEHVNRHGVTLDKCEVCGGIWLDRGELETLIEAVRPPVVLPDPDPQPEPRPVKTKAPKPTRQPQASTRDQRRPEKPERKKSKGKRYRKKYSTTDKVKYLLKEILD